MKITLNHKTFNLARQECVLPEVLNEASIQSTGIAVAINGKVVPADKVSRTIVNDGDNIIVIKAFYGG